MWDRVQLNTSGLRSLFKGPKVIAWWYWDLNSWLSNEKSKALSTELTCSVQVTVGCLVVLQFTNKLPLGVNVCVCMVSCNRLVSLLWCIPALQQMLWIPCDPDLDKCGTEDEWMNKHQQLMMVLNIFTENIKKSAYALFVSASPPLWLTLVVHTVENLCYLIWAAYLNKASTVYFISTHWKIA